MAERPVRSPVVAIVDDDPSIRSALDRLTRALGYEALVFDGVEPLLATLDQANIAFVVTDVQMPGLSGLDLLRILAGQRPHLPVMVMTAYPSEATRERALALGAFAYYAKPFEADQFERCLTTVLGARPLSRYGRAAGLAQRRSARTRAAVGTTVRSAP